MGKGMFGVLDCEATSLHPVFTNLLEFSLLIFDKDFGRLESFSTSVKTSLRDESDQPIYYVCPQSMDVNKINLLDHDQEAESVESLTPKLNSLLKKYTEEYKGLDEYGNHVKNIEPLLILGQNPAGDVRWMKNTFPGVKWHKYISYRLVDTHSIAKAAKDAGKLPATLKLSLGDLCKYFEIHLEPHRAYNDSLANAALYQKLVELIADNSTGVFTRS